jgi:hypothetical protein
LNHFSQNVGIPLPPDLLAAHAGIPTAASDDIILELAFKDFSVDQKQSSMALLIVEVEIA